MFATDRHYLVTERTAKSERVVFGWTLPLTKKACNGFIKGFPSTTQMRVIKRTTARKLGLI